MPDLNPPPISLSGPALQSGVYRYDSSSGDANAAYTVLPNIRWTQIVGSEGPDPTTARFEYIFDDNLATNLGWPSRVEQVFALDAQGQYVVGVDDELVVLASNPDGSPLLLWHGFAQIPQIDLSPGHEACSFVGQSVAVRAFDKPIHNRIQRNADKQTTTDGSEDVVVHLPCRFNPADNSVGGQGGYLGNCVAAAYSTESNLGNYGVFLDETLIQQTPAGGPTATTYWFVTDALEYLIATSAAAGAGAETIYITWPTFSALEDLLNAQYPTDTGTFTPGGPATATANITLRDYDAEGKNLPVVIADMLGYCGFVFCWATALDSDNLPMDYLRIYRRDGASTSAAKSLYLQPPGSAIDPTQSNVSSLHISRDMSQVINAYRVETAQKEAEITVYLAPLFEPAAGDELSPASAAFYTANAAGATAVVRDKYRKYGADECGEGHWNASTVGDTQGWVVGTPLDLSKISPPKEDGTPTYVRRYRKPSHTLNATDSQNKPLRATLEVISGFSNTDPYLADKLSNVSPWFTVPNGWELLPDRLGIRVTTNNPDQWSTGNPLFPKIAGITSQSVPTASTAFILRLTTVIETDQRIDVKADKRVASPTKFVRGRITDGRDHFQYCTITPNSLNYTPANGADGTNPIVIRDDTAIAKTHAYQLRSSTEFPTFSGSVEIPYLTSFYEIGDLVTDLKGRGMSLQTNIGAQSGEAPCFAWVVERTWHNDGNRQSTTLQLSDKRATTQGYRG